MVTASAPGKVFCFGEHAVVYGQPAVGCAIERRARVTVTERGEGLRVHLDDLTLDGFTVEYEGDSMGRPDVDVADSLVEAGVGYINEAIEQVREATDADDVGFEITVESDIPLGAGLGSSAAVVVATIAAGAAELGVELDDEEIARRAYEVEHTVQDGQASRADTFWSTMGGAVLVEGEEYHRIQGVDNLPFVIGYDGGAGDTGALVAGVREVKDRYEFAAETVDVIGDLVRQGESALAAGDIAEVGRLMNFNHGLLSALGVSARSLDAMVWAARDAGAMGAKLTGAGGGGCIVALDETDDTLTALRYTPGCETAFRAELDTVGVRME